MRKRKQRGPGTVELNMAAMLDMAFQLLAFFILTFRPSPVEGHLQLQMPPPTPVTQTETEKIKPSSDSGGIPPDLQTLNIFLESDAAGQLVGVKTGLRTIIQGPFTPAAADVLGEQLKSLLSSGTTSFDKVQLHVDSQLRYEELMKIVDLCTIQTLPDGTQLSKVSFVERTK